MYMYDLRSSSTPVLNSMVCGNLVYNMNPCILWFLCSGILSNSYSSYSNILYFLSDAGEELDCDTTAFYPSTKIPGLAVLTLLIRTLVSYSTFFSKLNKIIFSFALLSNTTTHVCYSASCITVPVAFTWTLRLG